MTNEVINLTNYYYKKTEIDSLLNQKMDKSDVTDMDTVELLVTYTDNKSETLTLFKKTTTT